MATTLATETWTGTTGAAWPSQWTSRRGNNTIQSNAGRMVAPSTASLDYARTDLTGMSTSQDMDLVVTVQSISSGVQQFAGVHIDSDVSYNTSNAAGGWYPDNCYALEMLFNSNSSTSTVTLVSMDGGAQNNLATATLNLGGNTRYKARLQRIGTALNARVWAASATEPTTWNVSTTISGSKSGRVGLTSANGNVAAARSFNFDDLTVTDAGSGNTAGFKLWSGSAELPLTTAGLWNGSALVPVTVSNT